MAVISMLALGWLLTSGAVGGEATAPTARAAQSVPEAPDVKSAQLRFRRGVELYKDGDVAGAMAELRLAYKLAPTYQILYNLGQISCEQRDYAAALQYFRRYLDDGEDAVPAARREEVSREIERLHERVGRFTILTPDGGAEVLIDDVSVGFSPLPAPVPASVGRHRIEVVAPSGERQRRVLDVASGQLLTVAFPPSLESSRNAAGGMGSPPVVPRAKEDEPLHLDLAREDSGEPAFETGPPGSTSRWVAWSLAAALAGGAVVTGVIAVRASSDLHRKLASFPIGAGDVDGLQGRERHFALATDALAVAAAVATSVALYLTFSHPSTADGAVDRRRAMVEF